ncbi:MBL fold metallo-hydrolase [Baekduia soli]|uniref:MBL fold metallo-hydrolase n=1 Tax=Baekduia soli TaxID=496014 RepID=A0A5B8U2G0_9ACTN|nr:MBL fold metallo-hydrolase [Baekduia soli]QEC47140.1 MBL fold metallo-hydrolase [Baekduia soli]
MSQPSRKREVGRGERVLPGVWRLRLPLPWPGIPHCNAWALAAGDGIVLVDTGLHEPGSMGHLERALAQVNLRLDLVRLLVCTHAHADHYGQAATIVERTGCELWMHPRHQHMLLSAGDPEAAVEHRIEIARQSGVPDAALRGYGERSGGARSGVAAVVAPDRPLVSGVEIHTDLGTFRVFETPGHAPSHVCLYQEDRRLLISGDHLLGRVSLYYEYGYSPDPTGEFLHSLDLVQELDARLCLAGHGRTFTDVQAHVDANRSLVHERLDRVAEVLASGDVLTAYEAIPRIYGREITPETANWWLSETLSYLRHLELTGRAHRLDGLPERWRAAA